MSDELIELQRFRGAEAVAETKEILDEAEIEFRLSSTTGSFDLASIGSGQDGEVIVSVLKNHYEAARAALEKEYLSVELPTGHHLLDSTDDELAEILGQEANWSPFDVAHARQLAKERGIDMAKVKEERAAYLDKLRQGKRAPQAMILAGWVFSALGGLIGLGIAWSLVSMKEKTPDGEFFTYDDLSRETGSSMMRLAIPITLIGLFLAWQRWNN